MSTARSDSLRWHWSRSQTFTESSEYQWYCTARPLLQASSNHSGVSERYPVPWHLADTLLVSLRQVDKLQVATKKFNLHDEDVKNDDGVSNVVVLTYEV